MKRKSFIKALQSFQGDGAASKGVQAAIQAPCAALQLTAVATVFAGTDENHANQLTGPVAVVVAVETPNTNPAKA